MTPIFRVNHLVRSFATLTAVNDISFSIPAGRCFGLLGPNGAGKTTTIEMMEGLITPTSGEVLYCEKPLGEQFREEAGIQFQHTALQDFLTTRETLSLFASLYRKTVDLETLIALCSLEEFLDQEPRHLSGGQRQRLLLAIALINDPKIIFLDEPTTGLDPQARRNFWQLINNIKQQQKTVVITTHYMEEAYQLCDEILIMDHGKIIAQGSPKNLLSHHFDGAILELPNNALNGVVLDPQKTTVTQQREHCEIHTLDVNNTLNTLLKNGISLNDLRIRQHTLEDLFIELTGHELRT
jgi:ABC-2 type transport system ATP-binding protein